MPKWLLRVRGAIGMGLTWAVGWSAVGMVPRWIFGFNTDVPFPLVFGVLGFIAGVTFSAVLTLFERRRELDQLTLPRFAGWGAISGIVLAAIFTRIASLGGADVLVIAPIFAVACAACASGSLALAKRAEMRELREGSGETATRLTDYDKRKLSSGRR
ncbi:MAG TPA: hypothetical protein VJ840_13300 [Gemmatimonadaceae bacterium]|nr:hypothetical protein [Gemmatimonadaceae bacterium]